MLKIGEFSRLSQVTVKTLHHYDEIGLLKPSQIDQFTDYRYYTLDQLPRIHSIMALKELGLSLDEIAQLLVDDLPPEQLRGLLRLKQVQAEQRLREEQARLAQIAFRLRQIEQEGRLQTVDIVIKRVEPYYAMTIRTKFANDEEADAAAVELMEAITSGRIQWNGSAPTNIYYESEFQGDYSDCEYTIPVAASQVPTEIESRWGAMSLRQLPAIEQAATYMHQGDYPSLKEKFLFLQRWSVENGYTLGEAWRFVYHRGPMHNVDPSDYLTELQHPIERRHPAVAEGAS
jgi:DNA-binding transcriptional MerR regulator